MTQTTKSPKAVKNIKKPTAPKLAKPVPKAPAAKPTASAKPAAQARSASYAKSVAASPAGVAIVSAGPRHATTAYRPPAPTSAHARPRQGTRISARNTRAIELLDSWANAPAKEAAEQRATLSYLEKALDEDRLSDRPLFPAHKTNNDQQSHKKPLAKGQH